MSLKGSLQTVALPEVLNFLADTGKSGEFHVSGNHGEGRLWFDQGHISGFEVARAEKAFEAVFELLRIEDAEFDFDTDADIPAGARFVDDGSGEVRPALEAAEARLAEWREIVAVVPSLAHRLQLRAETPAEPVILEPDEWMLVVAIGAGHTVGEVIDERGLQEFDGCKAVRGLVDASLVEVLEPAEAAEVVTGAGAAIEEPVAEDRGGEETVFEEPAAEEPAVEGALGDDSAISAGLLRFGVAPDDADDAPGGQAEPAAPEPVGGDHYAALRAAMVEIGGDQVSDDEDADREEPSHAVYQFHADPDVDGRAALQALLSEVTEDSSTELPAGEAVDGLADRGPWTEHELSTMDGAGDSWSASDGDDASKIVPLASAYATGDDAESDATEPEEPEQAPPPEEPINRGLLLKFLSSVRN